MAKRKVTHDTTLANPLMQIAQGLGSERSEQVWEEQPVGIQEFIESRQFLNQKWNGHNGCRPKILEIAIKVVEEQIREVILLLGKGSGKDYISSIIHLYGIYRCLCMFNPQAYFGLAPSPIYFVNTARNDTQAKKVFFTQFRALLAECPWFRGKYNEPGLQNVSFIKNIEAISVNSQAYGWLGFNTIQWVGDELAFFLESDNDEESASRAQECWEAAFGSCKTRFPKDYKMIGITTPRYDDDFVMKKFEELSGRKDGFARQAATWDMNPAITKEDFKFEFIRDPRRAMRDFGAVPQGVLESFWPEPDRLEALVAEGCKKCPIYLNRKVNSNDYYACFDYEGCTENAYKGNGEWRTWLSPKDVSESWGHYDLAKSKDRLGFAYGCVVGEVKVELDSYKFKMKDKWGDGEVEPDEKFIMKPIIKIWALGWVSNRTPGRDTKLLVNDEYNYTAIMNHNMLAVNKKGIDLVGITFDQYQSVMLSQTLEDKGYQTDLISLDRTDEIPVAAKYAILENRVIFPWCALLIYEAKFLKHINAKKVDHAKKASKDVWDSLAGTIYNCELKIGTSGTFVNLETQEEED